MNSGKILGSFGITTGVFLIFFFGEIPRVRTDILSKIPVLGPYWKRPIDPEDNVCFAFVFILFALVGRFN